MVGRARAKLREPMIKDSDDIHWIVFFARRRAVIKKNRTFHNQNHLQQHEGKNAKRILLRTSVRTFRV